jgi:hypothetical protein
VSNLSGLIPNTSYYIRAYATNSLGTSYSSGGSGITTLDSSSWVCATLKKIKHCFYPGVNNTCNLTSPAGSDNQTTCINTSITNITYATTGCTGVTVTGLPYSVTGAWLANVVTISGTPTNSEYGKLDGSGTWNYTVKLNGGFGQCNNTGTITVRPNNTVVLTSAVGTNAQTVSSGSPITNITYATTGATGATVTGLPTGINGTWSSNVVTISGTHTGTAAYTYTVTLTGGCGVITTIGTITYI